MAEVVSDREINNLAAYNFLVYLKLKTKAQIGSLQLIVVLLTRILCFM